MTGTAGVGEPFEQHHARALAPAGAVAVGGERLAPPVRGQAALAAELDERAGGGHHRDAAGQRQVTLAGAQRLRGQVNRDQRRRARGVDGDRRALEAERVGDPAGDHAARTGGAGVPLGAGVALAQQGGVVAVEDAGVDAGAAAAQLGRVEPGPLQRLPGRLQQQALLRVHGDRLARADAEERGVETPGAAKKTTFLDVRRTGVIRVRVVQPLQVPAAVVGEPGDAVAPVGKQPPVLLGRGHATRVPQSHADDHDRVVQLGGDGPGRFGRRGERPDQFPAQEHREGLRGRVVEGERGRQPQAGRGVEPVAQLDRGERVETELAEGAAGRDGVRRGVAEHRRDLRADQVEQHPVLVGGGQTGQALEQSGGGGAGCGRTAERFSTGQAAQEHRQAGVTLPGAQHGPVEADRDQEGPFAGQRRVEDLERLGEGQGGDAPAGQAAFVEVGEVAGHAVGGVPGAPGERGTGQATTAAGGGKGVQERVRGGVVALARGAEQAGHRGVEHERVQVGAGGRLVQVDHRVHLGAQHRAEPFRGEAGQDGVVEDTGDVDDRADVLAVQGAFQVVAVRDVAADQPDPGAGLGQVGPQPAGAGGVDAAAAEEQQIAYAVGADQMPHEQAAQRAGGAGDHGRPGVTGRVGQDQDVLADVPALADEPERLAGVPDVPGPHRRQLQRAGLEQGQDLSEHRPDPLRAGLEQVERPVRQVRDGRRVAQVGLAHLQEPSAVGQQPQRGVDELTGERVEHHVGAVELRGEAAVAGRGDRVVGQAERAQRVPFGRAGGGQDARAEMPGDLDGGGAHPARAGVHQHGLAGPDAAQVDQGVVGGEERHRDGGGLGERPVARHRHEQPPVGDRDRAEPAGERAHHPVAGAQVVHAGADLEDDAGALAAHVERVVAGVDAERDQHIAEVQAGGADGDPDHARFEGFRRYVVRGEPQVFQGVAAVAHQSPGG